MNIRRFRQNETDAVFALHQIAMESAGGYLPGPWDRDFNSIEQTYLSSGGEFLVGEIDTQIVAMGALLPVDQQIAEVKRLRVSPAMQGKGLGEMMLISLERCAKELGYRFLTLDTLEMQTSAVKLFRRNGYLETGSGSFEGRKQLWFRKELWKDG